MVVLLAQLAWCAVRKVQFVSSEAALHELNTNFSMECAHFLPHVPEGHKCGRMHGHSYRCTLRMTGVIDPHMGWFTDSGEVKKAAQLLVRSRLDHHCLNDIPGLENPTAENLAQWICEELHPALMDLGADLIAVTIHETDGTNVTYRRTRED